MNKVAHEAPGLTIWTTFTGLVIFMLAMGIVFLAVYTLLQTGQSILGEMHFTPHGWFYP
jgi:hypothetical protein